MANNIHAEQIKLVFFDIDETLYVKDKAYVPPSVYTAIRKLKERGIDTLARHLGYTADNVMAFGDGINDSEMIAHVGLGVAMGNALPELKQMAQYVTSDIEDDGILNALIALKIIDHVD